MRFYKSLGGKSSPRDGKRMSSLPTFNAAIVVSLLKLFDWEGRNYWWVYTNFGIIDKISTHIYELTDQQKE